MHINQTYRSGIISSTPVRNGKGGVCHMSSIEAHISKFGCQWDALQTRTSGGKGYFDVYGIHRHQSGDRHQRGNSSPLSDQVLSAWLRLPPSSASDIEEVILENSPVANEVMFIIDSLQLDSTELSNINAAQTGVSVKQELENEIALLKFTIQHLYSYINFNYLEDSLSSNAIDSVLLSIRNGVRSDTLKELLMAYRWKKQYESANIILDTLDLDSANNKFVRFQKLLIELEEDSMGLSKVLTDSVSRLTVEQVADDPTHPCAFEARSIVNMFLSGGYSELKLLPASSQERIKQAKIVASLQQLLPLNIFPNPTNGIVRITGLQPGASLLCFDGQGKIKFSYSITDKEMDFSVEKFPPGLYLIVVESQGEVLSSSKLQVIQ